MRLELRGSPEARKGFLVGAKWKGEQAAVESSCSSISSTHFFLGCSLLPADQLDSRRGRSYLPRTLSRHLYLSLTPLAVNGRWWSGGGPFFRFFFI